MTDIKQLDDWFDTAQLICTKNDGKTKYNFSIFTFPSKFASKVYNKDFTLQEVKDNQLKLTISTNNLNNNYNPINKIKRKEKKDTLKSARKLFFIRKEIIRAFKRGIFPNIDGFKVEKESEKESDEESDEEWDEQSQKELDKNKFFKYIENKSERINYELFEKDLNFSAPTALAKKLFETTHKNKNTKFVNVIISGLRDLKDKIKKISKEEIEIEKPDKILKIVEEILEFNKEIQSGGWLKILTPDQMLSRLPTTLTQFKAGNNSEKLKNEIRQLLYSLYR